MVNIKTLDIKQVAEILHYNEEYLRKLIKKGSIPAFKVGRKWLMNESDISKLLEV